MSEFLSQEKLGRFIEQVINRSPTVLNMRQGLNGLQQDVKGLRQDVNGLQQDVNGLQQDVNGLKQDVNGLQQDVKGLKQEQHRQGLMMEHMDQKLDILLEAMAPTLKKVENLGPLALVVEQHESRIDDLESVVKTHIADEGTHKSH